MNIFKAALIVMFLTSASFAAEEKQHKLRMSLDDTFMVTETEDWKVEVQEELTMRFANVSVTPKEGSDFDLMLYFKCDTPDLAQFDSSEKIKKSVLASSQKYLPYTVEKELELKPLSVKGQFGCYTVITDAGLAGKEIIPEGEFLYLTRGMIRLSDDSTLGFSLMTNEIDTPEYQKLIDYIVSFTKEKKNEEKTDTPEKGKE